MTTKQEEKLEEEFEKPYAEYLKVGEITVSSITTSIHELCGLALELLRHKEITDYLLAYEKKRIANSGSYTE